MTRIIGAGFAAVFAFAPASACAVELTDQDRAELRQRAQELHNQRARDPDFQPGQGRLLPQPAEEPAPKRAAQARPPRRSDRLK